MVVFDKNLPNFVAFSLVQLSKQKVLVLFGTGTAKVFGSVVPYTVYLEQKSWNLKKLLYKVYEFKYTLTIFFNSLPTLSLPSYINTNLLQLFIILHNFLKFIQY